MLLYRLAVQRVIEYFKLDQLFKEDETRLILLHKKPKPVYKTILKTDQTWNFYVSVLLSIIVVSTITITDAINNTDISISPWVERGKYYLKEKDVPTPPMTPYEYAHMNAFDKHKQRHR
ncbi:hypothetical protein O0L34_g2937 [Tuta absoluta]|nr:hypothetical protein O0L34_g2937 [Tuta absoluta]